MNKKILSVFLAIVLILIMTACGTGSINESDTNANHANNANVNEDESDVTEVASAEMPDEETSVPTEPEHVHIYDISEVVSATCTDNGYTVYTCNCGDVYKGSDREALGHKWGMWVTTKEATENAEGEAKCTCSVCGESKSRILAKLAENHTHNYTGKVTKTSTCSSEGVKTYTCSCGDTYTEPIAKSNHTYKDEVILPTCTKQGYTTHTCSVCKASYKDTYVSATDHSYKSVVTKPTCAVGGYTTHTCKNCGYSYVDSKTDAASHNWGDWVITKEPTTTATGKSERKCINCTAKETKTLPKVVDNHTHNYTSSDTKNATCTEDGTRTFVCSCGYSYTESIARLGHNYKSNVTSPTCTEKGYTTYTCDRCGHSYKGDYTKETGHSYTSKVTANPTCSNEGIRTYTCSCGASYTESIAKTDHKYKDTVVAPTCTKDGYTSHKCSVCGNVYTDATVPATGHQKTKTETVEPTCIDDGYTKVLCTNCGATVSQTTIESTGEHSYTKTMRMSDAAKAMIDKGYGGQNGIYINFTEWNVDVCPGCGYYNVNTMRFIYSDYQAANTMLGYINNLREFAYGTSEYNLTIDSDLLSLAQRRVKEISLNYYEAETYTNATALKTDGSYGVKNNFDTWNGGGGYGTMINKDFEYFGYAIYRRPEQGPTAACFSIGLFWTEQDKYGYG